MADPARTSRRLRILTVATALCYAVGYPLALIGHSGVGWVFVGLGGPFLIALLIVVIQRVHADSLVAAPRDERPTDGTL